MQSQCPSQTAPTHSPHFIFISLFLPTLYYNLSLSPPPFLPPGLCCLHPQVAPRKGSAVLFYNLLEDGNGDDLSLHAALPVWKGEKWLANFWVW